MDIFLAVALTAGAGARLPAQERTPLDPTKLRELVAVYVADVEGAWVKMEADGLRLSAVYLPDALSHRIAREYVSRREAGEEHQAAVRGISSLLPGWKQREGMAAVLLKIVNLEPRPRRAGVFPLHRLYTIQKAFAGEAVVLTGAQKKPLAIKLADPPSNLRALQLRVKKFWTTADGTTRRRAYDPDDPLSIGRKPMLSRPFSAFLIEEKPVEAELLLRPKPRKDPLPHLSLQGLKRYEGPFKDGLLDLNRGRRWDPIAPLELELRAPAGGLVTPPAVLELAGEVRAAASRAATSPPHPES